MFTRPILSRNQSKNQKKQPDTHMDIGNIKAEGQSALFNFYFSATHHDNSINRIALSSATKTDEEFWFSAEPVSRSRFEDVSISSNGSFTFFVVKTGPIKDTRQATYDAYSSLFAAINSGNYGKPARIWNFMPHILSKEDEFDSSYQAFNSGRLDAWVKSGPTDNGVPHSVAATGMGVLDSALTLICLTTRYSITNIENPRQDPTVKYPKKYGPKPPIFSRASMVDLQGASRLLFISGTGSIVGSETIKTGLPSDQAEEIFKNIEALISQENLSSYGQRKFELKNAISMRIYLKTKKDLPLIKKIVDQKMGRKLKSLYLQSEFCRPDLDLEIEAVIKG